jgi:hypothetical protein
MTVRPLPAGPVEHDDDGNPVPQPAENSDLRDLIQLLEYGRAKGFRIGPTVRVGKIVTQVRDLRQHEGRDTKDEEPDRGIFAEHGFEPE